MVQSDLPASTYIVTTLSDVENANDGALSLREALALANADPDQSEIRFDPSLAGGTISLAGEQLTISSAVTINGDTNGDNAADITISGNFQSRVFDVTTGPVELHSLTIQHGASDGGSGVRIGSDVDATISHTTLQQNVAGGTATASGGGILNSGNLYISDSTLAGNGATVFGGGIYSAGAALVLDNVTVANNSAASGGGIASFLGFSVENSTIAGNKASGTGGGIYVVFAAVSSVELSDSIVVGNSASVSGANIDAQTNATNSLIDEDPAEIFQDGTTLTDGSGTVPTIAVVDSISVGATPVEPSGGDNNAPSAVADSANVDQGGTVLIDVLNNDTDADGDALTIASVGDAANGTVSEENGQLRYTPGADFSGTDSFSYTVSDGQGGTDTATVSITVTAVNTDPNAADDSIALAYNTPSLIDVLSNDTDAEGHTLSITATTNGANGVVSIVNGQVQYTPITGFAGTDTFSYTVSDGNGGSDTASVTVTVASDPNVDPANSLIISEYVEGSGANQAIELYNPTNQTLDLSDFTLEVYADGSNVPNMTLNIPSGSIAAGATVVIANSEADADLLERADLTSDALIITWDGTVDESVGNDALVLRQGGVIVDSLGQVGVNPGAEWSSTVSSSNNTQGFLGTQNNTLRRDLSIQEGDQDVFDTFEPAEEWNGFASDTFDGLGYHFTVPASIEPTPQEQLMLELINAARENPAAHMSEMFNTGQANIDGAIDFFNVVQATAQSQVAGIASMAPLAWNAELASAAETHNNLLLQYDTQSHHLPDEPGLGPRILDAGYDFGSVGENVFSYAEDPLQAHAGFYIDWGNGTDGIQDPPGHRDAILDASLTEIGIAYQSNLGVDDEQSTGPIAVTQHLARPLSAGNPQIVGVVIDDLDEDDFYDIGEGLGGITVTAVGGGQTFTTTTWASGGYALEVAPNASYTVTFSGTALGADQTFTLAVGTSNVTQDATLGAIVENTPPVAVNDTAAVDEDSSVLVDALGNDTDADGDTLSLTTLGTASNGTVSIENGQIRYTPNANFNGTDSFTYTMSDGQESRTATVSVMVNPVNDAPLAPAQMNIQSDEDLRYEGRIVATDVDGDDLSYRLVSVHASQYLDVTVNSDGTFSFLPAPDFWSSADTFTYEVSDGNGGTAQGRVSVYINPVNDAPTVSAPVNEAIDLEFDPSTPVDLLAGASDRDHDALSIANVEILSGNGSDLYIEEGDGWLDVSNLDYAYLAADETEEITLRYDVVDGNGGSVSQTAVISILGANDYPDVQSDTAQTTQDTTVDIDVLANDTDIDGDRLEVSLYSHPTLETENGGIVTINDDFNTLNYDPNGAFDYLGAGQTATDSFYYDVFDGMETYQAIGDVTITISGANDAPDAVGDSAGTAFETAVLVNVLTNDTDPDQGDTQEIAGFTNGVNGTVTLVDGQLQYTPNAGFSGTDTFTYTLQDSAGASDTGTVSVRVAGQENVAPIAVDDVASVLEDGSVLVNALTNDSDANGDSLSITSVGAAENGTAVLEDGQIRYTPNADFNGTDRFSYTVSDGQENAQANVTITVSSVNDAPTHGGALSARISEDASLSSVDLLESAFDVDGDSLSVTNVQQLSGDSSAVSFSGNTALIDPSVYTALKNGESEEITATYDIIDGNGGTVSQRTTITISGANDAPDAVGDSAGTAFETAVLVNVLTNDTDPDQGDTQEIAGFTNGVNGTVTLVDGQLQYTPNAGFSGTDTFTYTLQDSAGASDTGTVSVRVAGQENVAPIAVDDVASVLEDGSVLVNALTNDSDANGDSLSITSVGAAENGTAVLEDGQIRYTPNADFNGTDRFSYTVSDGQENAQANVTITVSSVNDAPTHGGALSARISEDASLSSVDLLESAFDVDGDSLSVTNVQQLSGDSSAVSFSGNTALIDPSVYTALKNGESEEITATYDIIDGNGGTVSQRTTITISGANDAPDAVGDSAGTAFETAVLVNVLTNDTDPDQGDTQEIAAFTHGYNGRVEEIDGQLQYTPNAGFSGTDFFLYVVKDAQGGADTTTVTVSVAPPVNTAPVAIDDTANVAEDRSVLVDVLGNDSDPEDNSISLVNVSEAANGTVAIENGQIRYTPNADFTGSDHFTYRITDGLLSDTASVTVNVDSVNDAPTFAIGRSATQTGQTVDFDGLTNFGITGTGGIPVDHEGFRWSQFLYIDLPTLEGVFGSRYGYSQAEMSGGSGIGLISGSARASIQGRDFSLTSGWFTLGNALSASSTVKELMATAYDDGAEIGSVTLSLNAQSAQFVTFDSAIFGNVDEVVFTSVQGYGFAVDDLVLNGPDAHAFDFEAFENGDPLQVDLAAYAGDVDLDDDNTTLSYEIISAPGAGTARLEGTVLSFDPGADFSDLVQGESEIVTVQVKVTDSHGASLVRDISIIVYPDNTAPEPQADHAETEFDSAVLIDVLGNDLDADADVLTLISVEPGENGSTEIEADGRVLYTPNPGFSGTDHFTYTLSDGSEERQASVTVAVAPSTILTASADLASVQEDGTVLIDVLANDGNPGGLNLEITGFGGSVNGAISLENGQLRYAPDADFNGFDTFFYTVSNGVTSSTAAVLVDVAPVNDPITLSGPILHQVSEDDGFTQINLLSGAFDADGDALSIANVTTSGASAAIQSVSGSTLSLFPSVYNFLDQGEAVILSLSYDILDGAGSTVQQSADILIEGANDAPVAYDDSASTQQGVGVLIDALANDTDVDGEALSVVSTSNGANGSTFVLSDGSILYTPNAGFAGQDSFSYVVTDGDAFHSALVNVDVAAPENSAPVAQNDSAFGVADYAIAMNVLTNDQDAEGDALTVVDFNFTGLGTLTYRGNGNFIYETGGALATLPQGEASVQSFTYTVSDGQFTSSAQAQITVSGTYVASSGNMIFEGDSPTLRGTPGSDDIFVFEIDPTSPLTETDAILGFEGGRDEIWLPIADYSTHILSPGRYAVISLGNGDTIFVAGNVFSEEDLNISITADEFGF
jgi:VCBS repeat-containing protein